VRDNGIKRIWWLLLPGFVIILIRKIKSFICYHFILKEVFVKLGDITSYHEYDCDYEKYAWETLKNDILNKGIKGYIILKPAKQEKNKYNVSDGNHRVATLKHIYGDDYKMKFKVLGSPAELHPRFHFDGAQFFSSFRYKKRQKVNEDTR